MISRIWTPPPAREDVPSREVIASAFEAFVDTALRHIEHEAPDERTRAMAGLARRHSDVKNAINSVLQFADPRRPVPIETVNAASAVMDQVLNELTAFLDDNPIPKEETT